MPNTILLSGQPQIHEGVANVAITPGQLIEFLPPGAGGGELRPHTNAGQNAAPMVALESTTPKRGVATTAIDTAYAAAEQVRYAFARPGDRLFMWLAAGNDVGVGALLESGDNGALRAHTPQAVDEDGAASYTIYVQAPRFMAAEAVDNDPGAGGAAVRIRAWAI